MARVLIYSHDSFGLGHVRRCLAIAGALADTFADARVLILSGSPVIARFDLPDRVDYVSVPGIVKQKDGGYVSRDPSEPLDDTIRLRAEIIRRTAEAFDPDLFLVDKEPLGLRGEVADTLHFLKARGARLVLGLRDILDAPATLAGEWRRKGATAALEVLYDEIWVFGLEGFWDPLTGLDLSPGTRAKTRFTGYLDRRTAENGLIPTGAGHVLVTPGGGGDGTALVDWVLAAYERADNGLPSATILLGPFMPQAEQAAFRGRADRLENLRTQVFTAHTEGLFAEASGIVAMGGYNTFAEILAYDLPALLIPRETPRAEQRIRADRAAELGLVRTLYDDGARDPGVMAEAIRALGTQPKPSTTAIPSLLNGLSETCRLAAPWLRPADQSRRALV